MTDRLAELGALQWAVENLSTAGTSPNRLGLAGYIHAAYTDYQTWAAANPGVNPNRLSARGRLYGYFYDNASWSPSSLFANSEVGAWYDPSDLSTMFQDRAGTTPVTADGQTVGKILDKSGRGNHATAPSDAARPLYKTDGTYHWLQFDGVDDSLNTSSVNFTVTSNVTSVFGIRKISDAVVGSLFCIGDVNVNSNCLYIRAPGDNSTPTYRIGMKGAAWAESNGGVATAPVTNVITVTSQCATPRQELRINTVSSVVNTDNPSMAAFGNLPLYIGQSGSGTSYANCRIYSLVVRGALSISQEITDTETWVNGKTGAY